MKYVMQLL